MGLLALLIFMAVVPLFALAGVYAERKVSAFVQDRLGPMETGKFGIIQTAADILKMLMKEDTIPAEADRRLFILAPFIMFIAVFAGFAVMPLAIDLIGSPTSIGIYFLLAILALDVIGILMAGWGSGNKYALLGAMRSVGQMISYELPLGLSVLAVLVVSGSLDLQAICLQQGTAAQASPLFGIPAMGISANQLGGIFMWNILRYPLLLIAFCIFFVASLAEANRTPFDIPEAESELIAGYHSEYSGIRFAIMMLSEYGIMLLSAMLASVLFLGGWNTPLPNIGILELANWTSGHTHDLSGNLWGLFWLASKTCLLVFFQMLARWTYPRLRMDQLMALCWKYLLPISLAVVFGIALQKLWIMQS